MVKKKLANLLISLVAGVGFEPTTFRLWAWIISANA